MCRSGWPVALWADLLLDYGLGGLQIKKATEPLGYGSIGLISIAMGWMAFAWIRLILELLEVCADDSLLISG